MSTIRAVGLGVLGGAILTWAGIEISKSWWPLPPPPVIQATANVNIGSNCSASDVTIHVGDQVKWTVAQPGHTLVFAYSPFVGITSGGAKPVPNTAAGLDSGAVNAAVKEACGNSTTVCTYKYKITGGAVIGCPNDPVVVVQK